MFIAIENVEKKSWAKHNGKREKFKSKMENWGGKYCRFV